MGSWQIIRLNWKNNLILEIESSLKKPPVQLSETNVTNFLKIKTSGSIDFDKQIYLYNLNENGTPGFEVINPIIIDSKNYLINRGWIPFEKKDTDEIIQNLSIDNDILRSELFSLRQEFNNNFCDVTILRFGIIYGPRKSNWSAVESIFNQVKNQDKVTVGSLKTGRRFVHVSDIARGITHSLGLNGFNIINLTGNNIVTLKDIIDLSQEIFNKKNKSRKECLLLPLRTVLKALND